MRPHNLTVGDLMSTALVTVRASEPVSEALAEMELGVIRHLPVVDDHGRLVGLLSERDLHIANHGKRMPRVAELMTREVVTIRPEAAAHRAAELMLEYKIGSVAVVDEANTLIGIVTATDFLDLARRALLGQSLER